MINDFWLLSTTLIFHYDKFLFFHKSLGEIAFIVICFTRRTNRNSIIFTIGHNRHLTAWFLEWRIISQSQNLNSLCILLLSFKLRHKWILIFRLVSEYLSIWSSDFMLFEIHVHVFFVFFFCFGRFIFLNLHIFLKNDFEWWFKFFNFSGGEVIVKVHLF